jgi:hypothetical protein
MSEEQRTVGIGGSSRDQPAADEPVADVLPGSDRHSDQHSDHELIPLPEVARELNVPIIRVHQLIKDGQVVAIADADGRRSLPRGFIQSGQVVKGLSSVITLLRDAKYSDEDIVEWLCRSDEALPGSPLQALLANRGTEIKRRAQASGF